MIFEGHTGDPIGSATGAKITTKSRVKPPLVGFLGKLPELTEAARMSLVLSWHRFTSDCSFCKEMLIRQ